MNKIQLVLDHRQEIIIGKKYRLLRKIGCGSFGEIYLGKNIEDNKEVAIKMESSKTNDPQILFEAKLYRTLSGGAGIPRLHYYGKEKNFNSLVLDLLGPSLEDLFNFCSRHFTLKTVLMLADQMLHRLEFVHSKCYIHRDLKPDNFLMGTGDNSNILYLIDFGLAKKYADPTTNVHIQYRDNKYLTGTVRYASINAHLGVEQSRRDDMETIGHIVMYFNRGGLPWQGLKAQNHQQKYDKISEMKLSTSVRDLCKGFPLEFSTYINYCRGMLFDEKPKYKHIATLFQKVFKRFHYKFDHLYDWTLLKQARQKELKLASIKEQADQRNANANENEAKKK